MQIVIILSQFVLLYREQQRDYNKYIVSDITSPTIGKIGLVIQYGDSVGHKVTTSLPSTTVF